MPPTPLTLALSGGGAKCAAHAGVLAVLAEAGVPIGRLVGCSGGGVVAVLHALGYPPEAMLNYFAGTQLLGVWARDRSGLGLLGDARVRARLAQMAGDKTFADLAVPAAVVATDLDTGRLVTLDSGSLVDALVATISIPGLFAPCVLNGRRLGDGGMVNPLPVDVSRALGGPVVAVDVASACAPGEHPQIFEERGPLGYAARLSRHTRLQEMLSLVYDAIQTMSLQLIRQNLALHPPDLLLCAPTGPVGLFAFDLSEQAYAAGQAAARSALPALRVLAGLLCQAVVPPPGIINRRATFTPLFTPPSRPASIVCPTNRNTDRGDFSWPG
jgi:NTE family protein